MSGAQEAPGPGDADGRGSVFIDVKPGAGQACVDERYAGIAHGDADAHPRRRRRGRGSDRGQPDSALNGGPRCVNADPAVLRQVAANPAGFYCNIHNGAVPERRHPRPARPAEAGRVSAGGPAPIAGLDLQRRAYARRRCEPPVQGDVRRAVDGDLDQAGAGGERLAEFAERLDPPVR